MLGRAFDGHEGDTASAVHSELLQSIKYTYGNTQASMLLLPFFPPLSPHFHSNLNPTCFEQISRKPWLTIVPTGVVVCRQVLLAGIDCVLCGQVRLCLERKDFVRAQILIRKVSPRAFVLRPDKKGQSTGEVGIEGTTIEAPAEVRAHDEP